MSKYQRENLSDGKYVIFERGRDWRRPRRAVTFAFDTENIVLLDGEKRTQKEIFHLLKDETMKAKRARLRSIVWAWQCYDEQNGFFQTNDFYAWLFYQCRAKYKFGWCYNATFDFSQIDYQILSDVRWKLHERKTGEAYNRGQPWAYESIHNDTGSRYAYKLWVPYKNLDGHSYTHGVEYRDFMKIMVGGLAKILKDMNVCDNDGNPIRKLQMDYQSVDINNPTDEELDYCMVDVKGLYFAVKQFNDTIEAQSNNELHIFGPETNLMTAGGFAKHELLRSMYPQFKTKKRRIKEYQFDHPISEAQDKYYRKNHLYRGGISFVNPKFKGKMLRAEDMGSPMYRYDVNSEYPYAMAQIRDLVGEPIKKRYEEYLSMTDKEDYETILVLEWVKGDMLPGMLPIWYDPFTRSYVEEIDEQGIHLMYEREFDEMLEWYDLEYHCEWVILYKRGDYAYRNFVTENYAVKAQAKIDKNMALSMSTKLKLNSSYGKLSERVERVLGHYEMNEETNAVHFVVDETKLDMGGAMSVAVGALVTSYARCYILSKIREICGNRCEDLFVYIDTDSIHCFTEYDKADPINLGGLKLEAVCPACKYILPKTYIDVGKINDDGTVDLAELEIHSKGISPAVIGKALSIIGKDGLSLDTLDNEFSYGKSYLVLCAMNVPGGKVLVPTVKDLACVELAPDETMLYINTGITGTYLMEV